MNRLSGAAQTVAENGRLAAAVATAERLHQEVSRALRGKDHVVRLSLVALLARGHLLLEDVPGVGKTTLARALAAAVDASFARIQCTSDLMPADVLGASVLDPKTGQFRFRPGPIFHQLVLADEINRTTPKTQSALLEAMAEGQVSIEGVSRSLDEPFFVVATQNPQDSHGTYPLPESQLDRFLICTDIGYPSLATERVLLQAQRPSQGSQRPGAHVVSKEELLSAQDALADVTVAPVVHDYLLAVVTATREHPSLRRGASTRALLAFERAVRAAAVVSGRHHVLIDDVKSLAPFVLAHRLGLQQEGRGGRRELALGVVEMVLDSIPVPL